MASLHADWTPVDLSTSVFQATTRFTASEPQLSLVEAFVTGSHHIIVELDQVPIRRFAVHVSGTDPSAPQPDSLHVGFSVSSPHEWLTPLDLGFHRNAGLSDTYSLTYDIPQETDSHPTGLSFVIKLTDGCYLREHEGEDFHVGAAGSSLPSVVELPFSLPLPSELSVLHTMSVHPKNPFWLFPHWSSSISAVRDDTFFLLAELDTSSSSSTNPQDMPLEKMRYAALILQTDDRAELRATLFSGGLRLESGRCDALRVESVQDAAVATFALAADPFSAMRRALAAVRPAASFCSRVDKLSHPRWPKIANAPGGLLSSLGYCTWDAYGWNVHERDVTSAVEWLRDAGVPVGYVIVDDGWQGGGNMGPFFQHSKDEDTATDQPTLTSLDPNEKFSGSFKGVVDKHDVNILAWIAAIGYWGGVSGKGCGMKTMPVATVLPRGMLRNKTEELTKPLNRLEVLQPQSDVLSKFYDAYFVKTMSQQGVFSAKVDAQGLITTLCNVKPPHDDKFGGITRHQLVRTYRDALTAAAERAFSNGAIINCMACGPELVFTSGEELTAANVCWRTSDDHAYHLFEETDGAVAWHIICNAMNTILLGEVFPAPDWDMFRACAPNAKVHAAARVLSGGPIYISDTPPKDESTAATAQALLKSLTTRGGTLLRCKDVGRTTVDRLFVDSRQDPTKLFKIFNSNPVLGVVGLFNFVLDVPGVTQVTDGFAPCDVADFADVPLDKEYISFVVVGENKQAHFHSSNTAVVEVTVPLMDVALAHICPVIPVGDTVKVAILGQPHLMNCGGTVASYETNIADEHVQISFQLHDYGETLLWLAPDSMPKLRSVKTGDGSQASYEVVSVGTLQALSVEVPNTIPYSVTLSFGGPN